ncbi:MAG: hypothetical protein NVS4B11_33090 [Ktedonobacteraceae bacterium]
MTESINSVGQQIGNYRLDRLLGHGGFADVYHGTHVYLNTQAAIKLLHTQLDTEGTEEFRNESLTIAHLIHPHIVRVLDFNVEDNRPFLVMDYAPNGSLRERHPKGTRLPSATVVSYVKQVASALQYAHDQKLIHRDVKPGNMLLGHHNELLLSDFGIALASQSSRSQQTEDVVIGTMSYMAPEQIQGKARPASDQYALAAVVYEWLCGAKLFRGSYIELVTQHLSAPPPRFEEHGVHVPPAVEQVVRRALSKDYHQRFPRVQDFAQALELAYQTPSAFASSGIPPAPGQSIVLPSPPTQAPPVAAAPLTEKTYPVSGQSSMLQAFPPIRTSTTTSIMKKTGRVVRRGAIVSLVVLLLLGLGLCAGSFALYHYFTTRNTAPVATSGVPAAAARADDFMNSLANHTYDRAYGDLGTTITNQTSQNQFTQQAQQEDICYGAVTGDTRMDNNTTTQGNGLNYVYTLNRGKMSKPYQIHVTLQQDDGGNWQITDYNSNIASVQPTCK